MNLASRAATTRYWRYFDSQEQSKMPGVVTDADAALRGYCDLMEELKIRHAIIGKTLQEATNNHFAFEPFLVGEFCYLQLRMISELIALGCLLVHGDIPAARTKK